MFPYISQGRAGLLASLLLFFLLLGCQPPEKGEEIRLQDGVPDRELPRNSSSTPPEDLFFFGFDPRADFHEDARQYLPLLAYLERTTGYQFKLRFTPKESHIADELGSGRMDFAAIGAGTYLRAHEKYGVIPLVRGLNALNRPEYQSVIVTRPDSPIRTVADLRGKSFAFGDITSTQGHLIPRIALARHDILLNDLTPYTFTGSHHNCANVVVSGSFAAGGMQDTMGRALAAQGLLRIIHTSDFYPSSGIAANRGVDPGVREAVREALIKFQPRGRDAEGLYHWDRTEMPNGFVAARNEDYAELRRWAITFNLLDNHK